MVKNFEYINFHMTLTHTENASLKEVISDTSISLECQLVGRKEFKTMEIFLKINLLLF